MPNKIAKLYDAVDAAGAYSGEIGGPRNVETFYFAAAVADGDVVVSDTDTTTGVVFGLGAGGIKAGTTVNLPTVIGIADAAITAGTWGPVVTYGVKKGVLTTAAAIAAGDAVVTSATAGKIQKSVAHEQNKIGYALLARTGTNIINVFVQLR